MLGVTNHRLSVNEWFDNLRFQRFLSQDRSKLDGILGRACKHVESWRESHKHAPDPKQEAVDSFVVQYRSNASPLCTSMQSASPRPELYAQAYDGANAGFKDRCTMCRALFHFKTVVKDSRKIDPKVKELGSTGPKGRCAEALVHAQLYEAHKLHWYHPAEEGDSHV